MLDGSSFDPRDMGGRSTMSYFKLHMFAYVRDALKGSRPYPTGVTKS